MVGSRLGTGRSVVRSVRPQWRYMRFDIVGPMIGAKYRSQTVQAGAACPRNGRSACV